MEAVENIMAEICNADSMSLIHVHERLASVKEQLRKVFDKDREEDEGRKASSKKKGRRQDGGYSSGQSIIA